MEAMLMMKRMIIQIIKIIAYDIKCGKNHFDDMKGKKEKKIVTMCVSI